MYKKDSFENLRKKIKSKQEKIVLLLRYDKKMC